MDVEQISLQELILRWLNDVHDKRPSKVSRRQESKTLYLRKPGSIAEYVTFALKIYSVTTTGEYIHQEQKSYRMIQITARGMYKLEIKSETCIDGKTIQSLRFWNTTQMDKETCDIIKANLSVVDAK